MKFLLIVLLALLFVSCAHHSPKKFSWQHSKFKRVPSSTDFNDYVNEVIAPTIADLCSAMIGTNCTVTDVVEGQEIKQINIDSGGGIGVLFEFAEDKMRTLRSVAHEMGYRKWIAINGPVNKDNKNNFEAVTIEFR